ncbi:hypothetical protein QH494_20055 [Sphingomonas sp. AR_OL41]|nr:hypothetical protein [Sphingomonas sp. AR_OL41]MDH7974490.1 hypothetical protein [Sphingomonas sp. AR_OL41]
MDHENNAPVALIDLGAASVETLGGGEDIFDLVYRQPKAGLRDD